VGDYSDVKVVSPFGEISWAKVSRLSDEEMKALMIDVVNHSYAFLSFLFGRHSGGELIEFLKQHDPVPKWDDPEMPVE
jgi:ligand-binding SRPBCC domain-containing protein